MSTIKMNKLDHLRFRRSSFEEKYSINNIIKQCSLDDHLSPIVSEGENETSEQSMHIQKLKQHSQMSRFINSKLFSTPMSVANYKSSSSSKWYSSINIS